MDEYTIDFFIYEGKSWISQVQ